MSARIFPLLVVSVWINYLDRGNLSAAAPRMAGDLNLSLTQMGTLLSAFYWTYSVMQIAGGWLVDRYPAARVYAIGYAVWSAAMLATGFAGSFGVLVILRMLLGAGESVAFPTYSKILPAIFPESKRGIANALIDVGTKGGPALGLFVGGMLLDSAGWRAMFWIVGALSLLWLIPWTRASWHSELAVPQRRARGTFSELVVRGDAWLTFTGLLCVNYAFYFLMTWLPAYLVKERQYSLKMMAAYGALPYVATAIMSLTTGAKSDAWIRRGLSGHLVRTRLAVAGLAVFAVALAASAFGSNLSSMICLIIAFGAVGVFSSQVWAITQTLAGERLTGRWTGMQNAIGNLGGVLAPIVTGMTVDRTGSFIPAFLISAGLVAVSALAYGALLWRKPMGVEPI